MAKKPAPKTSRERERERQVVTSKDVGKLEMTTVGAPGTAPHIAAAVGVSVNHVDKNLAKVMETAMQQAILANAGASDDDMRAAILDARVKAKDAYLAKRQVPVK